MYISVKLPAAFGSFNQLRKENYPFNNLFTSYLAAVSRLGLSLQMDVEELVGYIEDRVFEGQRLPDVPEGMEPVNFRYKTEDPDVMTYIGGSSQTNRMAVMYIARMTLRLSAAYGTSLFRLTRLINDLNGTAEPERSPKKIKERVTEKVTIPLPKKERVRPEEKESVSMPRIKGRTIVTSEHEHEKEKMDTIPVTESPALKSAAAARAAVNALQGLTEKVKESENAGSIYDQASEAKGTEVETSPYLKDFM